MQPFLQQTAQQPKKETRHIKPPAAIKVQEATLILRASSAVLMVSKNEEKSLFLNIKKTPIPIKPFPARNVRKLIPNKTTLDIDPQNAIFEILQKSLEKYDSV